MFFIAYLAISLAAASPRRRLLELSSNSTAGCAMETGINYRGPSGNEDVTQVDNVLNVAACSALCTANPACEYYVYTVGGKHRLRCWLKKNFEKKEADPNCLSGHRCEKGDTPTPQRSDDYPFMLGRGYDLSVANLWDFSSGLSPSQILDMQDLPASCARADDSCVGLTRVELDKFSSVKDAFNTFQSSNSFSFNVKAHEVSASMAVAFGVSGSSSWYSESYGTTGTKLVVKRCHTLETGCLKANGGNIKALKGFMDMIDNSAKEITNSSDIYGCSKYKMDYWRRTVITQFGTHMATQTRNGAMMRYQELEHYEGHDYSQCMFDSVCGGMRLAGFSQVTAKFGLCSNSSSCDGSSSATTDIKYKCVAVGGHDMSGLPPVDVPLGVSFKLTVPHGRGKTSNCPTVDHCFNSHGLDDCRDHCVKSADCNVFNFCPHGASCTSKTNRCCMRKCDSTSTEADLKLTGHWKGWDVYVKEDGCRGEAGEFHGTDVAHTTVIGDNDAEKDSSCCASCASNPDCEFWVRSTTGDDCWLKKDYTHRSDDDARRGAMRTSKTKPEAQTMCNSHTSATNRAKFFNPNDDELNSDLTVVGMDFMPIENVARAYGASYEVMSTIAKAREYHMCLALPENVWQWKYDDCDKANGEGKCTCVRKCENGGKLDPVTCTCKCRGDDKHGWKGETCSETYGSCQPGPGTGNPGAARKCPGSGRCASWFHGYNCGPTEVCCITDNYGKCCPFGSSCHCGAAKCSCILPHEAVFLAMPPPPAPTPATYTQKDDVSCKKSKIMMTKNGVTRAFKTKNFEKAKKQCDLLDECVGVMDAGCDGEGKFVLCKESEKPLKEKPGHCIHMKNIEN